MSVTDIPRSAARKAAAYPPGPAPITAILRFVESDMKGFQPQRTLGNTEGDCIFLKAVFSVCSVVQDFDLTLALTTRTAARRLRRSSAGSVRRPLRRSGDDRRRARAAGSGAARIFR